MVWGSQSEGRRWLRGKEKGDGTEIRKKWIEIRVEKKKKEKEEK